MMIAVVDKHPIACTGLKVYLQQLLHDVEVQMAGSLDQIIIKNKEKHPEYLFLGFHNDPIEKYIEAIRASRLLFPSTNIIVITGSHQPKSVMYCFKAGAKGYIHKSGHLPEILKCLEAVKRGGYFISKDIEAYIPSIINIEKKQHIGEHVLTMQQYKVASYLSKGMKTTDIAETMNLRPSTISTVKTTIFQKLHVNNVIELSKLMSRYTA